MTKSNTINRKKLKQLNDETINKINHDDLNVIRTLLEKDVEISIIAKKLGYSVEFIQSFITSKSIKKSDQNVFQNWISWLSTPMPGHALALWRIMFGYLLFNWGIRNAIRTSGAPGEHFTHFVPLPIFESLPMTTQPNLALISYTMMIASLLFTFGIAYRFSVLLCVFCSWYITLWDVSLYRNHYYLICLMLTLHLFLDADILFSLKYGHSHKRNVLGWQYAILRIQIAILYFYAGIAKFNPDWVEGRFMHRHVFNSFLMFPYTIRVDPNFAVLMSIVPLMYDTIIGIVLLYPRTRSFGMFCCFVFHTINQFTLTIGCFPSMMLCTTIFFFDPTKVEKVYEKFCKWIMSNNPLAVTFSYLASGLIGSISVNITVQIIIILFLTINRIPNLKGSIFVHVYYGLKPFYSKSIVNISSLDVISIVIGCCIGIIICRRYRSNHQHSNLESDKEDNILKKKSDESPRANSTQKIPKKIWIFMLAFFLIQVLVPVRNYILYDADSTEWTEEGHRWSWRMKLRYKRCKRLRIVGSPDKNQPVVVLFDFYDRQLHLNEDYREILQPLIPNRKQMAKVCKLPDALLQYIHFLRDALVRAKWAQTSSSIRIYAKVFASLNGRVPQLLVDPQLNLAQEKVPSIMKPAHWIIPLNTSLKPSLEEISMELSLHNKKYGSNRKYGSLPGQRIYDYINEFIAVEKYGFTYNI